MCDMTAVESHARAVAQAARGADVPVLEAARIVKAGLSDGAVSMSVLLLLTLLTVLALGYRHSNAASAGQRSGFAFGKWN